MIDESGFFALILSFVLASLQGIIPVIGVRVRDLGLMRMANALTLCQCLFLTYAFIVLIYAHTVSDFSVVNVFQNSHSTKPLMYKISGVWGSHEGSMLLWALILSWFGAAVVVTSPRLPADIRANVLAVQGWLGAAFLLFIITTSNPFERQFPAPGEGNDLNPVLQDLGLAIHPPLLYLGYVGYSIVFSFAAAALLSGRIDPIWARFARPWVLISWIFLTLGIAMGSYWAYYTLGWGGFWFWDPVENASLMPWLAGTALLHSIIVMEKRDALKIWTVFLAVLAFSLSLLGTFLVRSGVLTSVHAFASAPSRGIAILAILILFIGGALVLFAWRAGELRPGGLFAPISREMALVLNNFLLTAICAIVVIGTLYPILLEALTGAKISVGAPLFNLCIAPFIFVLVILIPAGSLLPWKRGDLRGVMQRLWVAFGLGFAYGLWIYARTGGAWVSAIGAAIAFYLMVGVFIDLFARIYPGANDWWANDWWAKDWWSKDWSHGLARARGLPLSVWGTNLAHFGFAIALMGLAASGWGVEKIVTIMPNEPVSLGPFDLVLTHSEERLGPNYVESFGHVTISEGGLNKAEMEPGRRFFPARRQAITQPGIRTIGFGQVYVALADPKANGAFDARLYWKPLVTWIWFGAIVMAAGGVLSLSDRRVRLGLVDRPLKLASRFVGAK